MCQLDRYTTNVTVFIQIQVKPNWWYNTHFLINILFIYRASYDKNMYLIRYLLRIIHHMYVYVYLLNNKYKQNKQHFQKTLIHLLLQLIILFSLPRIIIRPINKQPQSNMQNHNSKHRRPHVTSHTGRA